MRRKCEGRVSARPSPCWMRCASPAQGAVPRAEGSGPPVARSHGLAQWQTRAQSAAAGRRQFVWRARPSRVCTPRLAERPRAHGTVVTEVLVPVVRVLVLEDHPLMAESVRALVARAQLALLPVVRTVAEAERVLAGLSKAERQSLAGVIDINLPDGSGLDLVRRWAPKGLRSVVLTADVSARGVEQALAAGAMAFVGKTAPPQMLLDALRAVSGGERFLCVEAERALEAREGEAALTARETEVLQLIGAGRSNKQIAQALGLAPRTVESHRERLLSKLGSHNAADLTREAIRRGLLRV